MAVNGQGPAQWRADGSRARAGEVRVVVVAGGARTDVVLPGLPLAAALPDLIRITGAADAASAGPTDWRVSIVGGTELDPERTPADLGLIDGQLLRLHRTAEPGDPPPPDRGLDVVSAHRERPGRPVPPQRGGILGAVPLLAAAAVLGWWFADPPVTAVAAAVTAGAVAAPPLSGRSATTAVWLLTAVATTFGALTGLRSAPGAVGWCMAVVLAALCLCPAAVRLPPARPVLAGVGAALGVGAAGAGAAVATGWTTVTLSVVLLPLALCGVRLAPRGAVFLAERTAFQLRSGSPPGTGAASGRATDWCTAALVGASLVVAGCVGWLALLGSAWQLTLAGAALVSLGCAVPGRPVAEHRLALAAPVVVPAVLWLIRVVSELRWPWLVPLLGAAGAVVVRRTGAGRGVRPAAVDAASAAAVVPLAVLAMPNPL